MKKSIAALLLSLLCVSDVSFAEEQDPQLIWESARLLYPTRANDRKLYTKFEKHQKDIFRHYNGTPEIPTAVVRELKALCALRYPASMYERRVEMQNLLLAYRYLTKEEWANNLPKEVKEKILAVGKMMMGNDYEQRYQWAVAETLAYRRLEAISFNKAGAQKKWPNCYQSQLIEVMGIRPGTPIPQKLIRRYDLINFIQPNYGQ